jgi:acyl-CoA synthetase (AMP-forming)/AMP-acid ligase II/acyl carrier protein
MSHTQPSPLHSYAPPHLCIHDLLVYHAQHTPDALAILAPGRAPLPYGRLLVHVNDAVQTLRTMGVDRHDRVAVVLPNGPEMATAFLTVAAGATCAPLNPDYGAKEFDFYLADLHAKALLVQAGTESPARDVAQARRLRIIDLAPMFEAEAGLFTLIGTAPLRAVPPGEFAQPDDVGLVLHTAGTTSRSKIVPLTHTNICASADNTRVALGLVASDRCLNVLPLFHTYGPVGTILASLMSGASIVCTPGFYDAPTFFAWMAEFRPTWYPAVPTVHQAILAYTTQHRDMVASCPLRFIRSGSAALSSKVLAELEMVFNVPVIETYGMTETSIITCHSPLQRQRKTGSVGVAAGPEVAIMDETGALLPAGETGEIVVRGTTVMQGYDNDAIANGSAFAHGWFRTNDQGYLDTDGYLFITGRLKEVINRGGEKITPQEVDDALMAHPAVAQSVTFAVPHVQLGEEVVAAVVLHQNAAATDSEIRQFAARRLAPFKVPRQIYIVEEIPKGSTGKLQRLGMAEKLGLIPSSPERQEVQASYTAPRTPVEEVLVGIWATVLGVEQVSVHSNFFALGGDSLLATQVMVRLREAFQVSLPIPSLFEASTVADLAKHVETVRWAEQALRVSPSTMAGDREEGVL